MPSFDESMTAIESALSGQYGRSAASGGAWGKPFAAMLAVVLERAIEAKKVARAIEALDEAGLLEPQVLAESEPTEVVEALRGAGVASPNRLAGPLRRLAGWLVDRHHGSAVELLEPDVSTDALREELAALNGIGPATADAILLHALRRGSYPVDRATYRILVRHDWLDASAGYDEARALVERQHPDDPDALAQLAGWFERVGREFCRPSTARCDRCPLRPFLPEGGPREPEGAG